MSVWNVGMAGTGGARDAQDDEEGMATVTNFAGNMVKLMRQVYGKRQPTVKQ